MKAQAFAPATVANVAVGFDILGFALAGLGEKITVEKIAVPEVQVEPVKGFPAIPTDPRKNTAAAGLLRLLEERRLDHGFKIRLEKKIPVGSGLGGSSTSAVGAIVAANALLRKKLSRAELLDYALTGEAAASGARHADNVGPCLHGGLVFVRTAPQLRVVPVPTPPALRCVVILPKISIRTEEARALLKPEVPLKTMVAQTANLAGFLLGCQTRDMELLRDSLQDLVVEPQRAPLVPYFAELQAAALRAGALGASLSGSGPALFALTPNAAVAAKVHRAMRAAAARHGVALHGSWVSPIAAKGAHLVGRR